MKDIIYYYFTLDVIKGLDEKYQDILNDYLDNTFLYSSALELPLYYDLFKFSKKHSYNMYDKTHNTKNYEVINLLKKLTIENNYNGDYLLMLISYISHLILDSYLEPYIHSFAIKTCLNADSRRYKQRYSKFMVGLSNAYYEANFGKKASTINFKKEISPILIPSDEAINAIEKITKDIYYFSFGMKFYEKSLANYDRYMSKCYNDKIGFKRFILSIIDIFTPMHRISKRSLSSYIKKNLLMYDFCNNGHKEWINKNNEADTRSLDEIIFEAKTNCQIIIKEVCDVIFYQKEMNKNIDTFLKFITQNNINILDKPKSKVQKFLKKENKRFFSKKRKKEN